MLPENIRLQIEQFHRFQILGIDLDFYFMLILSYIITIQYKTNFLQTFIIILLLSIFIHRILNINTRINQIIFNQK